jgi:hypothetical protein
MDTFRKEETAVLRQFFFQLFKFLVNPQFFFQLFKFFSESKESTVPLTGQHRRTVCAV